jgi:hypothetical protein
LKNNRGTCKESLIAVEPILKTKIPLILQILDDVEISCSSVASSPLAHSLIEKYQLSESEVSAIVLYTYDIGSMGKQDDNWYYQLNEILRKRSVSYIFHNICLFWLFSCLEI